MDLMDVVQENFTCDELVTIDELWAKFHHRPPAAITRRDGSTRPDLDEGFKHPTVVCIDTESEHYHWFKPNVNAFCFTVTWGAEDNYYVALPPLGDREARLHFMSIILGIINSGHLIVFHNGKYDLHVINKICRQIGIRFDIPWAKIHDTMLMSHCLNENRNHALKDLSDSYGIKYGESDATVLQEQVKAWIESQTTFSGTPATYADVPPYLMVPYAVQDTYLTFEIFREFYFQVFDDPDRDSLLKIYGLERDLMRVLYLAEERGVRVDLDFVYQQIAELTPRLEVLIEECKQMCEVVEFNPLAVEDVANALKKFGLYDPTTMTNPATGKPNLPEWALEQIDHPIGKKVLECRITAKLVSSYFQAIVDFHHIDASGQAIVSCNFRQIGARTGRMSVTEPALQTLPKKKGNVRAAFVAREDHTLIFADYSSQELRILAHYTLSWDPGIRETILTSDLHTEASISMYSYPPETTKDQIDVEHRKKAKNFNFATVYGAGVAKLIKMLGYDPDDPAQKAEGQKIYDNYHRRFPGIKKLKYKTQDAMERRGYIKTVYGRRHRLVRYLNKDGSPKMKWGKPQTNSYKASNSLIQGTAADMAKSAMVKVARAFEAEGMQSMILLQVHDEIIVEAPDHELEKAITIMEREMTDCPEIKIPMEVGIQHAKCWADAID